MQKGTIFQKSAPRGTVLQKEVRNGALFQKRVLFVAIVPQGHCSGTFFFLSAYIKGHRRNGTVPTGMSSPALNCINNYCLIHPPPQRNLFHII